MRGSDSLGDILLHWKEGLLCCLPDWLRKRLAPSLNPLILALGEQDAVLYRQFDEGPLELERVSLATPNTGQLLNILLKGGGERLIIRIPDAWVLRKNSVFPAAARDNLKQVIGFEMDRLTPFTVDQVFYDFRPRESDTDDAAHLLFELAVVPRARIEPWLTLLKGKGISPTAIDASGLWSRVNFLPPDARPGLGRGRILVNGTLAVVSLLLLAAVLGTPLWQKKEIIDRLNGEVAQARREANAAMDTQVQLEESQESLDYVMTRRREAPPVLEALKLVTELLPDDTWLQQFDLHKGKLELRGMSGQATALIQRLEDSPGCKNVGFRSPVVQAQGKERFHLSAELMASGE
jgi:general secretion pathway protein L